jgi:hypothetical protein
MRKQHVRALGVAAALGAGSMSVALVIGGAESAGFFKESTGFEAPPVEANGKPIVVKVQGLTKFGVIERKH